MGMIVLGMAFFTKAAANTVVQFQVAMMGTFAGAVLGIYALGLHVPWTNSVVSLKALRWFEQQHFNVFFINL